MVAVSITDKIKHGDHRLVLFERLFTLLPFPVLSGDNNLLDFRVIG